MDQPINPMTRLRDWVGRARRWIIEGNPDLAEDLPWTVLGTDGRRSSTLLRAIRYEGKKWHLYVEYMDGSIWRYDGVTGSNMRDMLQGFEYEGSIGKYFYHNIRSARTPHRISPPTHKVPSRRQAPQG